MAKHTTNSGTGTDAAKARLDMLLAQNKHRARELVRSVEETVIVDYTREPKDITFSAMYALPETLVMGLTQSRREHYTIHAHALSQIGTRLQIEAGYVRRLNVESPNNWRRGLLRDNLNTLMHMTEFSKRGDGAMRFLLRFVGDELRGFMSRSYGRHLASKPMLAAFLSACAQAGAAPTDAVTTAVKSSLSCYLPVVFEPTPKEYVAVGVRWSNSDFGAGRLAISLALMSITRGHSVVLSDEYSKVHIGSIIPEGDLEISDETATKEVEAAASAIKDAVDNLLKPASVKRLMGAIEQAREQHVDWATLRRDLKKFLYEHELTLADKAVQDGFNDLMAPGFGKDGQRLPTKWWAMSLVSMLAEVPGIDPERRSDLQQEAGRYIELKK